MYLAHRSKAPKPKISTHSTEKVSNQDRSTFLTAKQFKKCYLTTLKISEITPRRLING
jgi:hypothetical protein